MTPPKLLSITRVADQSQQASGIGNEGRSRRRPRTEDFGVQLATTSNHTGHQGTMNEDPDSNITDLKSGPFGVLYKAVRNNTQVLVNVRNNHKLLGRVKAYDRHMNL